MHRLLRARGVGVELHRVGLHAGDGADVRGEQDVGNLREHRIGQVLHHQLHPVRLGPTRTEERAGLCLAGLERHASPAEFAPTPHKPPVVRALVEEERLALRDAVHIDGKFLQLVGKGLLDVEQFVESVTLLDLQAVEDVVDVLRVDDGAVEVGREPLNFFLARDVPYPDEPRVIPGGVVTTQFDLQTLQTVAPNPITQQHGITVVGFPVGEVCGIERIKSADEMPGEELRRRIGEEEVGGKLFREVVRGGSEERSQISAQKLQRVGAVDGALMQLPESVMQREVEDRKADQRGEQRHRLNCAVIKLLEQFWKRVFLKVRPNFKRVPAPLEVRQLSRDQGGKRLQPLMPFRVGLLARPDPLHAQRRFAPALGVLAVSIFHRHARARDRDGGERLGTELQRDARLHREEVEPRGDNAHVGGLHGTGRKEKVVFISPNCVRTKVPGEML